MWNSLASGAPAPSATVTEALRMLLHPGAGYAILAAFALTLLLWRTAKTERRTVLAFAGIFVLSLLGGIVAGLLASSGQPSLANYVREGCILGEGLCLISLTTLAICRTVLPLLRLSSPRILQDVILGVSYFVWTLVWLRSNRVDVTSLIATSAVVTAVVGFSLQDTLGNILGGIAIQFDQSVQVGDWIRVDDVIGKVVEIRWRHTSLETRTWETVVVPNSYLVKNKFLVLGRRHGEPSQLRRVIPFNVDYRFSPAQVTGAVLAALHASEIPRVARRPEPQCLLQEFSESSARYVVRYWLTDLSSDDTTDSEVRHRIFFALKRAGVPLSIPAHAVFLTHETEERRLSKTEQALAERAGALRQTEFFGSLQPEELQRVAERLVPAPFARGDVMTRQGDVADSLYLIADGEAHVVVESSQAQRARVAELGPGSIFGEMGLMTGEPRSATVVASTAVECYRLDRAAFQEVLLARPALAKEISGLLALRRLELDAVLENLDAEARAERLARAESDILGRIRRFFSL